MATTKPAQVYRQTASPDRQWGSQHSGCFWQFAFFWHWHWIWVGRKAVAAPG